MRVTPIAFAIHQDDESPIFGNDTLRVTVRDDAGGPFCTVDKINPVDIEEDYIGFGRISLNLDEIRALYKIMSSVEEQGYIKLDEGIT